jgi:mono/diheme cytochrome c family protein
VRPFLLGVFVALAAIAIVALGIIQTGAVPARQDVPLGNLEKWMARTSLKATIEREAPQPPYPYGPPSGRDYAAAAVLYVQNCAVCHGTAKGTPTAIARGFSVRAPQLGKHGVEDDPEGETYWKIAHGIRMTAMPSFGQTLDPRALWQLTYFMKHMDALPPRAQAIWENPKLAPPPTPLPAPSPPAGARAG